MGASYPLIHVTAYSLGVAGIAGIVFYRPSWARTYTTFGRYVAAAACFMAVFVCEFLAFYGFFLVTAPKMPAVAAALGEHLRFGVGWSALAITIATLAMPAVRRTLRRRLQAAAGSPELAHRLAGELQECDYAPPRGIVEEASALFALRDIDESSDWLPIAQPIATLRRATTLLLQVKAWEEGGKFCRFLVEARQRYDELRQRFDRLTVHAARAIDQIESVAELRLLVPADDPRKARAADDLTRCFARDAIADLCSEISAMHRDVCMLVARAVLATERRERGRCAALARMGFTPPARHHDQGYEALFEGIAWISLSVFVYFYVIGNAARPGAVLPWWGLVIVISLTQGAALATAIVPKLHYAFASGGLREREPIGFELLAGVSAVAVMVAVNAVAATLTGEPDAVARRLHEIVPYLAAPFMTACTLAWLVQDHRWGSVESERGRRHRDAAVMAGAWLFVTMLSRIVGDWIGRPVRADLVVSLAFSAGMGGLLGYLIPFRARFVPQAVDRIRKRPRDGATAVTAASA